MKYLMFIKHAESYRGEPIPQALMDAMGEFVTEGFKSGVLKDTAGLKPTAEGFRVRLSRGQLTVTDGPFTESQGSRGRLCHGGGRLEGGGGEDRAGVHGAAPRALAGVRGRVRGAAARGHVEPRAWSDAKPPPAV